VVFSAPASLSAEIKPKKKSAPVAYPKGGTKKYQKKISPCGIPKRGHKKNTKKKYSIKIPICD